MTELRRYGGALVNPTNQGFNVPNTVAAPGSSIAVAGGAAQLQGAEQRSGQTTWKFPKKIYGIYGDWVVDIDLYISNPSISRKIIYSTSNISSSIYSKQGQYLRH